MNSNQMNALNAIVDRLGKGEPAQLIEKLYLTTLSRRPTMAESEKLVNYVKKQGEARTAYSDVLWALLNSSEFRLNH